MSEDWLNDRINDYKKRQKQRKKKKKHGIIDVFANFCDKKYGKDSNKCKQLHKMGGREDTVLNNPNTKSKDGGAIDTFSGFNPLTFVTTHWTLVLFIGGGILIYYLLS